MNKIVGIQFKEHGKVYDFDTGHFVLKKGDRVLVVTDQGPVIGRVCAGPHNRVSVPKRKLKKIFRMATPEEVERFEKSSDLEESIYKYCYQRIIEKSLPMRLVSVEKRYDSTKVVVYFTADGRVDFRDLVKDLLRKFRTRIEMRQIGIRHQSKMVGGLGPCGRALCCATFLNNFAPVTIKMAKEQNISINPSKISGMCGRLMCCLAYEHDHYQKIRKHLPKIGKKVLTKEGEGKVIRQNILKKRLTIILESGNEIEIHSRDLVRDSIFKKKSKRSNH